jgi:uncharacterized glyoxalase superfamily protein PhnB
MATVIPVLAYVDVTEATYWLYNTFGFRARLRIGAHRAQLVYGDGAVILTEPEEGNGDLAAGHSVHVRVADADLDHERAASCGALILNPPTDHPYRRGSTPPRISAATFLELVADVDPASRGGVLVAHNAGGASEV